MPSLICNLPSYEVWVRKEYLTDHKSGHGEYVKGVWVSAKSIPGRAFYFETYLPEYAAMYDKLPISAFLSEPEKPEPDMELPEIPLSPSDPPAPQFGFVPDPSADGDLLDAANSLTSNSTMPTSEKSSDFKSVWDKRKSSNPSLSSDSRDSIYNRIDRISTGRGESLMDRYADRFGSDLDREIIVLRKKDQDDITTIKPTVELLCLIHI